MNPFVSKVKMAELKTEEDAEHYGTKGMKWGVHRALKKLDAGARADFIKERDAKWLAKVEADPKLSKVSRIAARAAKKMTKKLKQDYKDRGLDIKKNSLDRSRYDAELKNILEQSLDKASNKVHKTSPSRLNEVQIHRHPDGSITAVVAARTNAKIVKQFGKIAKADANREKAAQKQAAKDAKEAVTHAEGDVTDETFTGLEFLLVVDEDGFVDDVVTPFDAVAHSDLEHDDLTEEELEELEDELAHYGVKGMRWGRRKTEKTVSQTPVEVKTTPGKRVQARGGSGQPAHADAIEKAANLQKARSSTTDALSTPELKKLVERMNLEANYNKLNVQAPTKLDAGKKFVWKIIKDEGSHVLRGKKGPIYSTIESMKTGGYEGTHRKK